MPLVEIADIESRCVGKYDTDAEVKQNPTRQMEWKFRWWNKTSRTQESDGSSSDEEYLPSTVPGDLLRWRTYPKLQDSWHPAGPALVPLGASPSPEDIPTDLQYHSSDSETEYGVGPLGNGKHMAASATPFGPGQENIPQTTAIAEQDSHQHDEIAGRGPAFSQLVLGKGSGQHHNDKNTTTVPASLDATQAHGDAASPFYVAQEESHLASGSKGTVHFSDDAIAMDTPRTSQADQQAGFATDSEVTPIYDVRKGLARFKVASKAKGKQMRENAAVKQMIDNQAVKGGMNFINQTVVAAGSLPDSITQMTKKKDNKLHWLETLTPKELKAELNLAKPVSLDSAIPDRGQLW